MLRELKELDSAGRTFETARRREPENHGLTKQLAEIYLQQNDFPRACKLKVDMARSSPNADTRFELFCEAGEIWAKRADELEMAAERLRGGAAAPSARPEAPRHPQVALHRALRVGARGGDPRGPHPARGQGGEEARGRAADRGPHA